MNGKKYKKLLYQLEKRNRLYIHLKNKIVLIYSFIKMSQRRHMMSHEVVNFHEHTPNKRRSILGDHSSQPTNLYRSVEKAASSGASDLDPTQQSWIGKYFIPMGYEPSQPNKNNYVLEREIANYTKRYTYQVLFIGRPDAPKYMARGTGIDAVSKPDVEYRPNRTNIFLDMDNVIRRVEFF